MITKTSSSGYFHNGLPYNRAGHGPKPLVIFQRLMFENKPQFVLDLVSRVEPQRTARLPDEQERLQHRIAATDRAIDTLIYQLYNLTPEEITIVEAA
jgi:hypothetical protein